MARRKVRIKPSLLVQPDPLIDKRYEKQTPAQIQEEIEKCKNGIEGLKYFIDQYIYVQNKIKPEILSERPNQFKHIEFEKEKINLKLYNKQIEYLDTLFNNRLTAAYKSRQCLPEGSIVYTPNGPIEIQNLVVGDLVYSFNEQNNEIEIDIVDDKWESGIRMCREMRTIDGNRTIQGENHPFLLDDNNWKVCADITNGDSLMPNFGNFGMIDVPEYEAKLLGQFITDGSIKKQPRFTNTNYDYIIDVSSCIHELDPNLIISITERDFSNDGQLKSWDLYPHLYHGSNKKNSFHNFLIKMEIYGKIGDEKVFPKDVFKQNKKSISVLLNRCFAGDGWFTKARSEKRKKGCEIGFGSPSKKLVYQVKQLLQNYGITGKIKLSFEKGGSGKPFYRLIITHREHIKKFYDEIGIYGKSFDYEYEHKTKSKLKKINKNIPFKELMCYDISVKKNKNFIFEGQIVHNTGISTVTQAYILQYATFNENKEIVIVSKTESDAIKFLASLYYMYNHLPFFLRRQYSKAVKKSFHLGSLNKASKIEVLTSTSRSGRSFSATILILDEAEFIDHANDLWAAAQPTLSATGGQAIVISTPWMYKSWFWSICHGDKINGVAFKTFKINWTDIPGRDRDWYKEQCAELNHDRLKIMTELDMQWIVPFQRYYSEDYLTSENTIKRADLYRFEEEYGLGILIPPKDDEIYYFGIDTYEGGNDHNAGIIIGDDMRVYCYFKTQRLDIFELIKFLCDLYHTKACVERNRGFWLVKEFIDNEIHKKYILFRLIKKKQLWDEQFGYLINGENRKKLIASTAEYLKYVYNFNQNSPNDPILLPETLMEEMNYFIIKKSRVEGLETDDLIFALIAALYVRDNKSSFFNWKDVKERTSAMETVNKFYGTVNESNPNKLFHNDKLNMLMARSFISSARGGKNLSVKEFEMLEQVITAGQSIVQNGIKEKEKLMKEKIERITQR